MTTTTLQGNGPRRILSTAEPRGRRPNPGEREGVLDLIAKANAAGRRVTERCDSWPIMGCPECRDARDAEPTFTVHPCGTCGAVRG